MDKNMDENKAEPKILLERYSICYIPTSGMCKSFCKFKKIDIKKMKSVSDSGQIIDFESLKCFCKSVIESNETELKNLKKSYKSLVEAKKNDIEKYEFIYQSALKHKKLDVGKWQKIYNETAEAEKLNDIEKYKEILGRIREDVYVYVFIKSPEFGDDKWHLDFSKDYGSLFCYDEIDYISSHGSGANEILCRTSGMKIFFSATCFTSFISEDIDEVTDPEIQIKVLKDAGFYEFTMQLNDKANPTSGMTKSNKLKIVDEEGNVVDNIDEEYHELDNEFYEALNKNKPNCEHINLAHIDEISSIYPIEPDNLHSVIILNKNAEMKQYGDYNDKSPFCEVENGKPLTFYCEPGSKIATDILSKCRDGEKYPEFYNATIVFMSPNFVAEYQKNLDDVDSYLEMEEFIKPYKENKDYFSFKLSWCSNQRIEQLLCAQNQFSNTWEDFVRFMELIGVKEKSEVKDVEHINESADKNDKIGISDNRNKNKKDIEPTNDNKKEEAKIVKSDNQSEIEPELKDENKTSSKNASVVNLNTTTGGAVIEDPQLTKSEDKKEGNNKTDEPEENLGRIMRYLKNHLPRIFKFINAIRRFFSRFISRSKNKSKLDDKNILGNVINKGNQTNSLFGRTSALSSKKNVISEPNNMENHSVNHALQQE